MKLEDIKPKRLTAKTVCNEIKKRFGYEVELVNGNGYFYFVEPDHLHRLDRWSTTSVYVNSLNQMDLEGWMGSFENLLKDNE